jgi:hypothetical protein
MRHFLTFLFLLIPSLAVAASFVANPSFELNYNATFPGYSTITNWTGGSGVNQSTGPFHNAGTPIPDGTRVGFQQGAGTLSQAISGLTAGKRYWIQFYYDARGCCGGAIDISVRWNGTELVKINTVTASSAGAPYKFRNVPFDATTATGTLSFVTTVTGDATVDYDAVSIVQRDLGNATVVNPGFEASGDSTAAPYAGWITTGTVGLNRSGGVFANNGMIPEQDHVIYLQGQNSSAKQTVSGLVPGENYTVSAAVNARTSNTPTLRITAQGTVISEASVTAVGTSAAYGVRTANFTAPASSVLLEFTQTAAGDQTVLLDNVKVLGLVQDPLPCLGLAPTKLELAPTVQATVNVTVPAQLLAFPPVGGVNVIIRSPNPLVARIPSGIDDVISLTWVSGDPLTKSFLVEAVAPGSVILQVLNSATLCVDQLVTVNVTNQLVRNPSFELDSAAGTVGYGAITGWDSTAPLANTGLNRAGMPFLDNGAVPDAAQVAFIQHTNTLSQMIAGLVPNTPYWLQCRYNARTGGTTQASVRFAENAIGAIPPVTPVGGTNAFYTLTIPFTPATSSGLLEFATNTTGDATLLLDAVTIIPRGAGEIVLQNPSFDASGRIAYPGYLGGAPIAGWTITGGVGLNSDGVGPFTDNGDAPDQEMVFFIQNAGSLAQNISGLLPGSTYTLAYAVNTRSAGWTAPGTAYHVTYAGTTLGSEALSPVNGSNPYQQRYLVFNATAAAGELKFTVTSTTGDQTLLLDNIRLVPGNADPGNAPLILTHSIFAGNALRLAWPLSGPASPRLQWSLTMQSGTWLDVTQPAVLEGSDFTIYEPMDDSRRFYRLVRP